MHQFVYNDLAIGGDETHYLDASNWRQSGQLVLKVDQGSDGTIDQTVKLDNQLTYLYMPLIIQSGSNSLAGVHLP